MNVRERVHACASVRDRLSACVSAREYVSAFGSKLVCHVVLHLRVTGSI